MLQQANFNRGRLRLYQADGRDRTKTFRVQPIGPGLLQPRRSTDRQAQQSPPSMRTGHAVPLHHLSPGDFVARQSLNTSIFVLASRSTKRAFSATGGVAALTGIAYPDVYAN
jgi:hypothetical protein